MTTSSTSCEHVIMYPERKVDFKYVQTEIKSILSPSNRHGVYTKANLCFINETSIICCLLYSYVYRKLMY